MEWGCVFSGFFVFLAVILYAGVPSLSVLLCILGECVCGVYFGGGGAVSPLLGSLVGSDVGRCRRLGARLRGLSGLVVVVVLSWSESVACCISA